MLKRLLIATCTLLFAGSLLAATPAAKPHVLIATSLGEIEVELDPTKAPISVKNFLEYVDSGYYDGTLFHRVILGFMVQTGGFSAGMQRRRPAHRSRTRPTTACSTSAAPSPWPAPAWSIRPPASSSST